MVKVAEVMAARLNQAWAPVVVAIPLGGWSFYNRDGLHFRDVDADRSFVETLRHRLRPEIPVREIQGHVNDPPFISEILALFEDLMKGNSLAL
jgi:uncharacterized protein (UPF0261 family)